MGLLNKEEEARRFILQEELLENQRLELYTEDGSVDFFGNPILKHHTGNWRACLFILGTECCERLAYFGIATNLVTYLTTNLHQNNVEAARTVTNWIGTCYLTPLIGAVIADTCWGRYWTIAVFSTIYFVGMSTLTLSASLPDFKPPNCVGSLCPEASPNQFAIFYLGLYLIALGTGGIKPCVSSFGADQFDEKDSSERVRKGSFFNWFFMCIYIGSLISSSSLVWVQENCGWGLGFAIPTLFMALSIGIFFAGTWLYRFQMPNGSPLTRVCQVVVASVRKRKINSPVNNSLLYELPDNESLIQGSKKLQHIDDLRFLDKAATMTDLDMKSEDFYNPWRLCTVTQVEELKILVRMFPIWASIIMFAAVYSQIATMFVEQGMVLDTTIGSFRVPPASLSTFNVVSAILWVPIYDAFIVPVAKRFTGKERGITELQRIGIGLFISILAMLVAALVEMKRLEIAKAGLVQMSILWQIPQYVLVGASEVFTFIGQVEFFYGQSPDAMRSVCSALAAITTGLGSYLCSFILTVVSYLTAGEGKAGWIPDDLNQGHLDYFFLLLAALSSLNLLVFVYCAMRYTCKMAS